MLSLGSIRFGVLAVTGLELSASWRHGRHAHIEGPASLQALGRDLRSVSIAARFHADYADPDGAIDQLTAAADRGDALTLQRDDGRVEGDFVIRSLRNRVRKTFTDGRAWMIDADLALVEYVGEGAAGPAPASILAAPLSAAAMPIPDFSLPSVRPPASLEDAIPGFGLFDRAVDMITRR